MCIRDSADTMLLSYSLDNGLTKHNMDDLAYYHFQHTCIKFKDVVGTGKNEITFDKVTIDNAVNYAAEDSLLTFRLFKNLYPRLIKERANFVYKNIDFWIYKKMKIPRTYLEKSGKNLKHLERRSFPPASMRLAGYIYKTGLLAPTG